MTKSVYIDTTIPSYYVDERVELVLHISRTREWWNRERHAYDLYTSAATLLELGEGEYPRKARAQSLMQDIALLTPDPILDDIVEAYLNHKLMPSYDVRDAIHLSFASYYKMDYLLTWNCRHLANIRKQEQIRVINMRLGLSIPSIITPLELLLPEEGECSHGPF